MRGRSRWIAGAIDGAGWLWVPLPFARGTAGSADPKQKPRLRTRATEALNAGLPTAPRRPLPQRGDADAAKRRLPA